VLTEWWTVWWTFLWVTFFLAGSFFLVTGFFATAALVCVDVVWEALAPPHPATARAATPISSVRLTYLIRSS
jgi:hypothetical protein